MTINEPEKSRIVTVYKPFGWTSFDAVNYLKKALKIKKIGHAGTLDPRAEGVLVVAIGRASTKQIPYLQDTRKIYRAKISLGVTTASDDAEFKEENKASTSHITDADIYENIKEFTGVISQKPPHFSAVKVNGVRSYLAARKGKKIELSERNVEIFRFDVLNIQRLTYQEELVEYEKIIIEAEIECSKGTYIRSIARDLGEKMGVGGYLLSLIRTAVGPYTVDNAKKPEEVIEELKKITS